MSDEATIESGRKGNKLLKIGCMSAGILMVVFILLIILAIAIPNFLAYRERSNPSVNPTLAVRQAATLGQLIRNQVGTIDAEALSRSLAGKRETAEVHEISGVLPKFRLEADHPFDYAVTMIQPDARDRIRFCITATLNRPGGGGRVYYHSHVQNEVGWIDRSSIVHFQTGEDSAKTCRSELRDAAK